MATKTPPDKKQAENRFPDANKKRADGRTDEDAGVPAADMRKGSKQHDPDEKETTTNQPKDKDCGCG